LSSNDFSPEYNGLYMDDFNFMPFFEVRLLTAIDPKYDIFKTESDSIEANWDNYLSIDYDKLSAYI